MAALQHVSAVGSNVAHVRSARPASRGGAPGPRPAHHNTASADSLETALANHLFSGFWNVQRSFKQRDKTKTGTVSHSEFREALQRLGVFMDEKQFRAFANVYDRNNSGRISYAVFNHNIMNAVVHAGGVGGATARSRGATGGIASAKYMPRFRGSSSGLEQRVAQRAVAQANGITNAFREFDVDRSGGISLTEFHHGLKR